MRFPVFSDRPVSVRGQLSGAEAARISISPAWQMITEQAMWAGPDTVLIPGVYRSDTRKKTESVHKPAISFWSRYEKQSTEEERYAIAGGNTLQAEQDQV